jgi:hypothetical protein
MQTVRDNITLFVDNNLEGTLLQLYLDCFVYN